MTNASPMDPLPFYTDSFVFSSVTMAFRAYFLRGADDATMLDVRCIAADPTRDLLERQVSRCPLGPFLRSIAFREFVVSDTLDRVACVDGASVALFWKDVISLLCIEGALCFLRSSSLPRRGVRFSVEFRMRPRRGVLVDYRMIDDVLVLDGTETGRSMPVEKLTRVEYGDEGRFREKECAICFEEFEGSNGEDLARMPCSHTFHYGCLQKWLVIKLSCPLCRLEIGNN